MTDYRNDFIRKGYYKTIGLSKQKILYTTFITGACSVFLWAAFNKDYRNSGDVIIMIVIAIIMLFAVLYTIASLRSSLTIDSNGIRYVDYGIWGKCKTVNCKWADIERSHFHTYNPLAKVDSFRQYIKYLRKKEDRYTSSFPQVKMSIFDDISDYIYVKNLQTCGDVAFWNIRKVTEGGETFCRCGAAIYDCNDKLLSSSENRYYKKGKLYDADGTEVVFTDDGVPDELFEFVDEPDIVKAHYNVKSRDIIFSEDTQVIKRNGKKFAALSDCNLTGGFFGRATKVCSAINYFSGAEHIDINSYCKMRNKAVMYFCMETLCCFSIPILLLAIVVLLSK